MARILITPLLLLIVLLLLVVAPLAKLFTAGFYEGGVFTLKHFSILLHPFTYKTLINTLIIASGSTLLSTVLGVILAWCTVRVNTPFRGILGNMVIWPMIISPLLGALAWATLLSPKAGLINILLTRWLNLPPLNIYSHFGVIWVTSLYLTPYVYIYTSSSLRAMDPALEEASSTLGASNLKTAFRITLPLSRPAIVFAAILIFIVSLGIFDTPAILGIPGKIYVVATEVYSIVSWYPPEYGAATALSLLLFLISFCIIYLQRRMIGGAREYVTITGKAYQPRIIDLGRGKYITFAFCIIYVVLAVGMPLSALLLASFLPYLSPEMNLASMSLKNYIFVLENPRVVSTILNTLLLASVGATIGILLAFFISYTVYRTELRGRAILNALTLIPVTVPAIVLGFAYLWLYIGLPIYGTLLALLLAYITRFLPVASRATDSTMFQIHSELEESARILGASALHRIRTVIVPLAKYGLLGGWVLLFILISRELATIILLYTPQTTVVPALLFDLWENGLVCEAAALSLVLLATVVIPIVVVQKLGAKIIFEAM